VTFSSLSKTYQNAGGRARALNECSLEVERGTFTVIVGRSGCGKTTLLKCIAGLETPDSGTIDFGGDVRIGFMFQDPRLLPWFTIEENLRLAFSNGPLTQRKTNREEQNKLIHETLALAGLEGWEKAYPGNLSGGMAQRASLARCLCRRAQLLLLDEPLSALDAFTRSRLRKELCALWENLGLGVILVTHDIDEAVYVGDTVYLMEEGSLGGRFSIDSKKLPRPRNYHSAVFQEYCRRIEEAIRYG
jgi:sulfonate transport system ATP-binding protein